MIAVGVDTHKERHYAVALDHVGQTTRRAYVLGDRCRLRRAAGVGRAARRPVARSCSGSRAPAAGAPACASTCNSRAHGP